MSKLALKTLSAALLISNSSYLIAADDPSIKGDLRSNIHAAMNRHIDDNSMNQAYYLYDAVEGKLLKMTLKELHSGIVKKGDFFVSCADFVDHNGRLVDVDFMVRRGGNGLVTTQALVHSIDGRKRKYHLESL